MSVEGILSFQSSSVARQRHVQVPLLTVSGYDPCTKHGEYNRLLHVGKREASITICCSALVWPSFVPSR
jgi:hypothetical protein